MNDFTKEELEYLHRKFMLTNGDDFEHGLEAKLQGMIDNYCADGIINNHPMHIDISELELQTR